MCHKLFAMYTQSVSPSVAKIRWLGRKASPLVGWPHLPVPLTVRLTAWVYLTHLYLQGLAFTSSSGFSPEWGHSCGDFGGLSVENDIKAEKGRLVSPAHLSPKHILVHNQSTFGYLDPATSKSGLPHLPPLPAMAEVLATIWGFSPDLT